MPWLIKFGLSIWSDHSPGFASVSAVVGVDGRVRDASVGLGLPGRRR